MNNSFLLKIVLTPLLIGLVSLIGRRWGPSVSGWLIGLPLTSGPVAIFLALDHGAAFAADAARGTITGGASVAIFCLTYSQLALRLPWQLTLPLSWLVYFAVTALLQPLSLPLIPAYLGVLAVLGIVLALLPPANGANARTTLPWWDLLVRMLAATSIVLLLTSVAPALGSHLSGLLTTFPLFAAILGGFAHAQQGPTAAIRVMRGLVLGLFSFASFFLVVGALLVPAGIGVAFGAAIITALALQGSALWLIRRTDNKDIAVLASGE